MVNLESKQNIRIGRGHDSDIRVTDISVSRFHALIKKEKDGSFVLEDNNSKFGTLVLMQTPKIKILENQSLPVQIGRSYFTFDVKKPFSIFACLCSGKKSLPFIDYQTQNAKSISFDKSQNMKVMPEEDDQEELESEECKSNKPQESFNQKAKQSFMDTINANKSSDKDNPKPTEVNNEVFFKVLEGQDDYKDILGNVDENADNNSDSGSSRRDINNFDVNGNKIYFERANTNFEPVKMDMRAIKKKLKHDLESLRRVRNFLLCLV